MVTYNEDKYIEAAYGRAMQDRADNEAYKVGFKEGLLKAAEIARECFIGAQCSEGVPDYLYSKYLQEAIEEEANKEV